MRRTLIKNLALISAILFPLWIVSCSEKDGDGTGQQEEDKSEESVTPKVVAGTFTFTASPLKQKWEAGDKIYVHGAYGPAAQTITLTSADISEDGRTASAALDGVTEYPLDPDGLYAAWPAEAVVESDNLQEATLIFSGTGAMMAAAYLDGDNFTFADVSSGLRFKAAGYTDFAIAGAMRPGLRVTDYEVEYISGYSDFSRRKSDGYPFLYGTLDNGTAMLWYSGSITLKNGISIYLGNGNSWTGIYTISEDFKLKAGEIKDLGDISASVSAYDGPAPKMPEMGDITKYSVDIEELSGLCLSADKTFLWAVGDPGRLGKIDFKGNITDVHTIGGDAEGVTINPDTGDLLIANEPNAVGIIKASDNYEGRSRTLFKIQDASKYGNSGMEGITWYKDNMIYCGTQTGSDLFLCDLSAETDDNLYLQNVTKKRLNEKYPVISEIGGLCYDPLTDWLWITDSESRKIFALTGDAEQLLGYYPVTKIGNAESICVDHTNGCIWIGHDPDTSPSSLYRIDFTGLDDAIIRKQ